MPRPRPALPCPALQTYAEQPPEGTSQQDLLRMAAAADAFELQRAIAACLTQLAGLPVEQLEWATVIAAFTLPDGVAGHDSSEQLRQQAQAWLQQELGDLELTLQDEAKCQQLERLPHAALLALLQDERTRVASEGTAVAAVALWAAAQEAAGSSVALEQRQQLAGRIRMVQLPIMYLSTVLPRVQWLEGVLTAQHFRAFTAAQSVPAWDRGRFVRCVLINIAADGSDKWRTWVEAGPRPMSACGGARAMVQVPAAELSSCFAEDRPGRWASPTIMFGGYGLGLIAIAEGRKIAVGIALTGRGTRRQPAFGPGAPLLRDTACVKVDAICVVDGAIKRAKQIIGLCAQGRGWPDFFGEELDMSAGWDPQRLAPFLHDGNLTLYLNVELV
jgi:hypothetical protein